MLNWNCMPSSVWRHQPNPAVAQLSYGFQSYEFHFMDFKLCIYGFLFGYIDFRIVFYYINLFSQLGLDPGTSWLQDRNFTAQQQRLISYACKLMESACIYFWRLFWNVHFLICCICKRLYKFYVFWDFCIISMLIYVILYIFVWYLTIFEIVCI